MSRRREGGEGIRESESSFSREGLLVAMPSGLSGLRVQVRAAPSAPGPLLGSAPTHRGGHGCGLCTPVVVVVAVAAVY